MGAEKAMYHFELLRGMLQRMFVAQTLPQQMQGVKAEPQETLKFQDFEKRSLSESRGGSRKPMEDDSNLWYQTGKRKKKQPGEGPWNPKREQQG